MVSERRSAQEAPLYYLGQADEGYELAAQVAAKPAIACLAVLPGEYPFFAYRAAGHR